jgi:predicted O-methyltransferase YrrM
MHFFPESLERYAEEHTTLESELLRQLNRETQARIYMPQMLSGHLQGQLLRMISLLVRPKNILEIGTFTGYSAICMSEGLQEDGILYTIDINEELKEMAERYFEQAGIRDKIDYRIGNATDIIPELNVSFDLVFIDADKINYTKYYELVFDRVNSGGVILADNVLWSGKIIEPVRDDETNALMAFNDRVQQDHRVDNVLITQRDGLMMIRKK